MAVNVSAVADRGKALMDELVAFGAGDLEDDATILCLRRTARAGKAGAKEGKT